MTVFVARAPGKVNLSLFVAVPREDGLHPLASLVQPVSLADELRLEPAPAGSTGDEVVCAGVTGPNLAADALAAYREATGWDAPPLRLTILKRVPVAAGMGGGSGDAAAALRLAAHAAGRPDDPAIAAIAPRLGADVPSQVRPGRLLMTGIGEHVEALPGHAPFALLVLPSDHGLSTPAVYREADRLGLPRPVQDVHGLAHAIRAGSADPPLDLLHNDLQDAARSLEPSIDDALEAARAAGAEHAMVSGSGPTVFGVFTGHDAMARARAAAARAAGAGHPRAVAAEPVGPEWADPRPA